MQSAWAVGWGAAVLLSAVILTDAPAWIGWRLLFAVGVLPALLILLLRRGIPEPLRTDGREAASPFLATLAAVFRPEVLRSTLVGGLFGVGAHGRLRGADHVPPDLPARGAPPLHTRLERPISASSSRPSSAAAS